MTCKYDDYDWDELPVKIAEAAAVLGYTKAIWDSDGTTPASEKDWDELSEPEKAAAKVLGYTPKKWDAS